MCLVAGRCLQPRATLLGLSVQLPMRIAGRRAADIFTHRLKRVGKFTGFAAQVSVN
jgi:hypothetical protein